MDTGNSIFWMAVTVDVDADDFDPSLVDQSASKSLQWRGVVDGIPLLVDALRPYCDSFGGRLHTTWFVRADGQLRSLYGRSSYLFSEYRELWTSLSRDGDEIAWHPHLYRRSGQDWVQETDPAALIGDLRHSWDEVSQEGWSPKCSRIGEAFHSNELMRELNRLGVLVDSTAMPGRVRTDGVRNLDWQPTPCRPYYPSRADYRVPSETGESVGILEVPLSMVETRTDYDRLPLRRYLDLSFRSSVIGTGLRAYVEASDYAVTIVHASSVLPLVRGGHPLLSLDVGEVRRNLDTLMDACEAAGKRWRFVTVSQFLDFGR